MRLCVSTIFLSHSTPKNCFTCHSIWTISKTVSLDTVFVRKNNSCFRFLFEARARHTHTHRELPIQFDTVHKNHTQIKPQSWKKSVMAIKNREWKKNANSKNNANNMWNFVRSIKIYWNGWCYYFVAIFGFLWGCTRHSHTQRLSFFYLVSNVTATVVSEWVTQCCWLFLLRFSIRIAAIKFKTWITI